MKLSVTDETDHSVSVESLDGDSVADLCCRASQLLAPRSSAFSTPCTPCTPSTTATIGDNMRCIVLRTGKQLSMEMACSEANLVDEDELLLLRKPAPFSIDGLGKPLKEPAPTEEEILEATEDLPDIPRPSTTPPETPLQLSYLLEQTKLSLMEFAGRLQSLTKEEEDEEDEVESDDEGPSSVVNEAALKALTDMGFPREQCVKALRLCGMDSEAATEWLLINAMDPSIDEPLPETPPRPKQKKRSGKWRRQEFVPSQSALHNLKELGFEEARIIGALRATSNNQQQACEILLSDFEPEEPQSLSKDSSLYKELFSNSTVLNGLSSPAVLDALIKLHYSPERLPTFLNHKDCGTFLVAVIKIIHRHVPQDIMDT